VSDTEMLSRPATPVGEAEVERGGQGVAGGPAVTAEVGVRGAAPPPSTSSGPS